VNFSLSGDLNKSDELISGPCSGPLGALACQYLPVLPGQVQATKPFTFRFISDERSVSLQATYYVILFPTQESHLILPEEETRMKKPEGETRLSRSKVLFV